MATMLSGGTFDQLAFPRPPTPITAKFSRLFGEQLIMQGIIKAPVAVVAAVLRNDLRV